MSFGFGHFTNCKFGLESKQQKQELSQAESSFMSYCLRLYSTMLIYTALLIRGLCSIITDALHTMGVRDDRVQHTQGDVFIATNSTFFL